MPEGVEVKLSAELIKPLVQDRVILFAQIGSNSRYKNSKPEGLEAFEKLLYPTEEINQLNMLEIEKNAIRITDVNTKGKFMYWTFSNGWYLLNTFGMSGQWSPIKGKHPCFIFFINDQYCQGGGGMKEIIFNDPRHFGTIKFTNNKQDLIDKLNSLGWDPLQDKLNDYSDFLVGELKRISKPISQVLMDQSVFAGVGNYIRAEALYLAKMSPWKLANTLSKEEVISLCDAIIHVMQESYAHQGATILTYKDAYGAEGKYASCFKVYGQKKDPLGNPIIKEDTPDKRTIHWCPTIQI